MEEEQECVALGAGAEVMVRGELRGGSGEGFAEGGLWTRQDILGLAIESISRRSLELPERQGGIRIRFLSRITELRRWKRFFGVPVCRHA